jgi:hypothetical protein
MTKDSLDSIFKKFEDANVKTNKLIATNEDGTYTINMPNGSYKRVGDMYEVEADSITHSLLPNYLTAAAKQRHEGDIEAREYYLNSKPGDPRGEDNYRPLPKVAEKGADKSLAQLLSEIPYPGDLNYHHQYSKLLADDRFPTTLNELDDLNYSDELRQEAALQEESKSERSSRLSSIFDNNLERISGENVDFDGSTLDENNIYFRSPDVGIRAELPFVKTIGGDFKAKPHSDNMGRIPEMYDVSGSRADWYNEYQNPVSFFDPRPRGYSDVKEGLTERGLSGIQKVNRAIDDAEKAVVAGARSVYDVVEPVYDLAIDTAENAYDLAKKNYEDFDINKIYKNVTNTAVDINNWNVKQAEHIKNKAVDIKNWAAGLFK